MQFVLRKSLPASEFLLTQYHRIRTTVHIISRALEVLLCRYGQISLTKVDVPSIRKLDFGSYDDRKRESHLRTER